MFAALVAAGEALAASKARAVVLAGEGRGFCAGLDMASMADVGGTAGAMGAGPITDRTHGDANIWQAVAIQWRRLPLPVIAAVHGVCLGGGLQIASGADIRVVAPDARLAVMEAKWGIVPDMAGFVTWRGLVRDDHLAELMWTAREFSGEEAVALGFATHADADPLARARAIAEEIAARSPDATRAAKRMLAHRHDRDAAALLHAESEEQAALLRTPNQMEAVMAGMARREPVFGD